MAGAARGCAAGSGQVGDANVVAGHIKWSKTVDPSAVQGIPGVVSENSRPFFVVLEPLEAAGGLSPRQTEVLCFAAAGCTERETALRLGIATATVRGHLARARERPGARSTCPQAT
jgi:DNA-binding CsgD family transcriptional regulator